MKAIDYSSWFSVHEASPQSLLILGENSSEVPAFPGICVSNRVDIHMQLQARNQRSIFSDFDLSGLANVDKIFFPVAKEKAVCEHIFASALSLLPVGGELLLLGKKNEGIKSYGEHLKSISGISLSSKKYGEQYALCARLRERTQTTTAFCDYARLRQVYELQCAGRHYQIWSKPGVFCWDRMDAGSQFLLDTLSQHPEIQALIRDRAAFDLGCGSACLSMMLDAYGAASIFASDNNAAALLATQKSLDENSLSGMVIASDCGDQVEDTFDFIVCNPPFHAGFAHSRELTAKFAAATARLLAKDGCAVFVCNAFVGIEREFEHRHMSIQILANDTRYKVLQIQHRQNNHRKA